MCKFVAVNRVGKPCALVAHARFEMGAVDLEFLRSAAYLIILPAVPSCALRSGKEHP